MSTETNPESVTPEQVLALPMGENDAGAATVREYLVKLLAAVWREGEGFSGKRPFGNSGWEYELYEPLSVAGFVRSTLVGGYYDINGEDIPKARALIASVIDHLGAVEVSR